MSQTRDLESEIDQIWDSIDIIKLEVRKMSKITQDTQTHVKNLLGIMKTMDKAQTLQSQNTRNLIKHYKSVNKTIERIIKKRAR